MLRSRQGVRGEVSTAYAPRWAAIGLIEKSSRPGLDLARQSNVR